MSITYEEGYGIPIRELARFARSHWLLPLCILVACTGAALALALLTQRVYRSEISLSLQSTDGVNVPQSLSQFQGVAQAVGFNLNAQGNRGELLAILHSRSLARQIVERHKLVPVLLKPKEDGSYPEPQLARAVEKFCISVLSVDFDRLTGIVTIGVEWTDPTVAASWATYVVEEANRIARQRAIKDSEAALGYLNSEAVNVANLDLKQAIYSLVETQMNRRMLANIRPEYAFVTIDPAVVPFRPIRPRRLMLLASGMLIGLILSVGSIVVRSTFRARTEPAAA